MEWLTFDLNCVTSIFTIAFGEPAKALLPVACKETLFLFCLGASISRQKHHEPLYQQPERRCYTTAQTCSESRGTVRILLSVCGFGSLASVDGDSVGACAHPISLSLGNLTSFHAFNLNGRHKTGHRQKGAVQSKMTSPYVNGKWKQNICPCVWDVHGGECSLVLAGEPHAILFDGASLFLVIIWVCVPKSMRPLIWEMVRARSFRQHRCLYLAVGVYALFSFIACLLSPYSELRVRERVPALLYVFLGGFLRRWGLQREIRHGVSGTGWHVTVEFTQTWALEAEDPRRIRAWPCRESGAQNCG